MALRRGWVSDQMGHKDIRVTLKHYARSRSGFLDRASRTRTGDLLGVIWALSSRKCSLVGRFLAPQDDSPNSFPNSLQPVLQ